MIINIIIIIVIILSTSLWIFEKQYYKLCIKKLNKISSTNSKIYLICVNHIKKFLPEKYIFPVTSSDTINNELEKTYRCFYWYCILSLCFLYDILQCTFVNYSWAIAVFVFKCVLLAPTNKRTEMNSIVITTPVNVYIFSGYIEINGFMYSEILRETEITYVYHRIKFDVCPRKFIQNIQTRNQETEVRKKILIFLCFTMRYS
jgi:hypothetical protein